jgi:hypothetical protein
LVAFIPLVVYFYRMQYLWLAVCGLIVFSFIKYRKRLKK